MKDDSDHAIQAIHPAHLKPGGHYSSAVVAGGFVYLAGQTPRDADRNLIGETIEEQTAATLDNVVSVLAAAGATVEDVVKCNVYLTDLGLFPRFNAIYARYFPNHKPARTTTTSELQGVMVEIDVVAYIGTRERESSTTLRTD